MSSHEHTRPRRGRLPVRTQAPEQTAALFGVAIEWRDAWRAEVVARNGTAIQNGGAKPNLGNYILDSLDFLGYILTRN
jgi:hypothetical protein